MVNRVVLDYFRMYSGMYSLEDLKKQVLSKGYSMKDVEEALQIINSESSGEKLRTSGSEIVLSESNKNVSGKDLKFIRLAGISGLVFLLLGLLHTFFGFTKFSVFSLVNLKEYLTGSSIIYITVLFSFFCIIFGSFFYYGFFKIGKAVNSRSLRRASLFSFGGFILFFLFGLFLILKETSREIIPSFLVMINFPILLLVSLGFLFNFISNIIFSISLIKLRNNVKFSLIAGISVIFSSIFWVFLIASSFYLFFSDSVLFGLVNYKVYYPLIRMVFGFQFVYLVHVFFCSLVLLK